MLFDCVDDCNTSFVDIVAIKTEQIIVHQYSNNKRERYSFCYAYIHTSIDLRFKTYMILFTLENKTIKPPKPVNMKMNEPPSVK